MKGRWRKAGLRDAHGGRFLDPEHVETGDFSQQII
jgi:hypothetical protein